MFARVRPYRGTLYAHSLSHRARTPNGRESADTPDKTHKGSPRWMTL